MADNKLIETMDQRLKLLSYSFLTELHRCPRKFQLTRLRAIEDERNPLADINQNLTFAFGHAVGEGVQYVLEGLTEDEAIWKMFLNFHADLSDRNDKQVKSFYHAVAAIQRFLVMRESGFLDGYELVYWSGKPATELSFLIEFPDGFKMRGSVDAVLRHTETGKVLVLEGKTDSQQLNVAKYKNSSQAVGYSVVLDVLFPELSSYEVLYLVYMTKEMNYEQLKFIKSHTQKALWIQELLLDIEMIKLYETTGVYPMYGHSCYDFYRECEFLSSCNLSTKYLVNAQTAADTGETNSTYTGEYNIKLTVIDLIAGQLAKNDIEESKHGYISMDSIHSDTTSGINMDILL